MNNLILRPTTLTSNIYDNVVVCSFNDKNYIMIWGSFLEDCNEGDIFIDEIFIKDISYNYGSDSICTNTIRLEEINISSLFEKNNGFT